MNLTKTVLELRFSIDITIESDGGVYAYTARLLDLPQIFGMGDSPDEAKEALEAELRTLWLDLIKDIEDDDFPEGFAACARVFASAFVS